MATRVRGSPGRCSLHRARMHDPDEAVDREVFIHVGPVNAISGRRYFEDLSLGLSGLREPLRVASQIDLVWLYNQFTLFTTPGGSNNRISFRHGGKGISVPERKEPLAEYAFKDAGG